MVQLMLVWPCGHYMGVLAGRQDTARLVPCSLSVFAEKKGLSGQMPPPPATRNMLSKDLPQSPTTNTVGVAQSKCKFKWKLLEREREMPCLFVWRIKWLSPVIKKSLPLKEGNALMFQPQLLTFLRERVSLFYLLSLPATPLVCNVPSIIINLHVPTHPKSCRPTWYAIDWDPEQHSRVWGLCFDVPRERGFPFVVL